MKQWYITNYPLFNYSLYYRHLFNTLFPILSYILLSVDSNHIYIQFADNYCDYIHDNLNDVDVLM